MLETFIPDSRLSFETVGRCAAHLRSFFEKACEDRIEIDLSGVMYCDSAGLALLLEAQRCAKHYKKQCRIVNVPQKIQALCFFYGLEQVLA